MKVLRFFKAVSLRVAGQAPTFVAQTQTHESMGSAPNGEIEQLRQINKRFNEQLELFDKRQLSGDLTLGKPLNLLKSCGLHDTEIFIKQKVLGKHLRKHGLSVGDVKNLAIALQTPLMVYEWGSKAKSLIVITSIETADGRKITAAIKLVRQCKKMEINEVASIHGKDIGHFLKEMFEAKLGGLGQGLRYVDKKKTLDWLGIAPPKGTSSLTRQEFSESRSGLGIAPPKGASSLTRQEFSEPKILIAKIIQNFENPTISPICANF